MTGLSLKTKTTLMASLLLAVTLSVTMFLAMKYLEREFRLSVARNLEGTAATVGAELDARLAAARQLVTAMADRIDPEMMSEPGTLDRFLLSQIGLRATFNNGLFVFSRHGKIVAGLGVEPHMRSIDYSFRDYVRVTLDSGRPWVSEPFESTQGHGHPIVMFTAPIFDAQGAVTGLAVGSIDLFKDHVLGSLTHIRLGEGGYLVLTGRNGTVIHHPNHALILRQTPPLAGRDPKAQVPAGEVVEAVDAAGVPVLAATRSLAAGDWTLMALFPLAEAYAPIEKARWYYLFCMVLMVGLAVSAVRVFMGRLTAPLQELTGHVGRISRGEAADETVPVRTGDEIGTLALAFRELLATIRRQEAACRRQRDFVASLIQHSAAPIFVIDREHRVMAWNRACEELTGVTEAQVKGTDGHWRAFYDQPRPCLVDFVVDDRREDLASFYKVSGPARLIDEGLQAEGWRTTPDGGRRYLIFSAAPIRDENGEVIAAIETLEDITERKEAEKRLEILAHYDALTGLPNRAQFFDRLDRGLAEAQRGDHPLALLYLDLDGFKLINDTAGHDAGDWVLTEVGRRLEGCVRESDTVARIGGDEFTIILGRVIDRAEAVRVANRILHALAQPFVYGRRILTVGGSIGISLYPEDGADADTLVKKGDAAMYGIKARSFPHTYRRTGT